jgi:hypothetical protein
MGTSVCVVKSFWMSKLTAKAQQKTMTENRISFCRWLLFMAISPKMLFNTFIILHEKKRIKISSRTILPCASFFTESTPEKCYDISTQQKGGRNPWKTTVATITVIALIWSVRMWHIYALCCGIGYRCVFFAWYDNTNRT